MFTLDPHSGVPIYRQLLEQVRRLIASGQLKAGSELPSVRDLALAVSGLLNEKVGGPSFKPALPADLARLNYAGGLKWDAAPAEESHRRGLYIHFQRTVPFPMLMAFDAPESNTTCTRRERSNSPLQALTLWNNGTFVECAEAFGRRMVDLSRQSGRSAAKETAAEYLRRFPAGPHAALARELVNE